MLKPLDRERARVYLGSRRCGPTDSVSASHSQCPVRRARPNPCYTHRATSQDLDVTTSLPHRIRRKFDTAASPSINSLSSIIANNE